MGKHVCNVPSGGPSKRKWTCPSCGQKWDWKPGNPEWPAIAWHGKGQVRNSDGTPARDTFFAWLSR